MAIPPAPSAPPTSVSVYFLNSTAITVQWGPVDCIHRNGDITGYTVHVSASGEAERTVSVADSVREATVTGLSPVTDYTVSVVAENSDGIGVYSGGIIIPTEGKLSTQNMSKIPSLYMHEQIRCTVPFTMQKLCIYPYASSPYSFPTCICGLL